jgi:hypothetical protein
MTTSSSAAKDPTTSTSRCKFLMIAGAGATSIGVGAVAGWEFKPIPVSSLACEFAHAAEKQAARIRAARNSLLDVRKIPSSCHTEIVSSSKAH